MKAIKELEAEQNDWSNTSRLCTDIMMSESIDSSDIPDDKKALFAKQEVLCKEVIDHLEKVQRKKQIQQLEKSYDVIRSEIRSKYEQANIEYERLQQQNQIPSN